MGDVARVAGALAGVRLSGPEGRLEWRYHGRLVARQLDDAHLVIRADFDFRDHMLAACITAGPAAARLFDSASLTKRQRL